MWSNYRPIGHMWPATMFLVARGSTQEKSSNLKFVDKRMRLHLDKEHFHKRPSCVPFSQKTRTPQPKNFFRVQSTRLADPFEPLNSSLAQSAEELGLW